VMSITNNKDANRSQTFTYDKLNRISTAYSQANTGPYSWGDNYWPDTLGNLKMSPMAGKVFGDNFQLSTDVNNHVMGMSYDGAGNLLNDGATAYSYDAGGMLKTAGSTTYWYDSDGQRFTKWQSGIANKTYFYGADGEILAEGDGGGTLAAEYVYFNGKRVARIDLPAGTVHYYLSDHLNSTSMVVSASGTIEEESDYLPFGRELVVTGPGANHYKFTGKERDPESNLDNFGARYNSSQIGRFMSPDPMGGSLLDPQTLNKYSYVRNNPVTLTDPTGMYTCADDQDKCQTKQDLAFEAARQNDLKSRNADVVRGASAYGDPTKDNGVNVGFGDLSSKGENGNTVSTIGYANGNLRADSNVTINSNATGADLDAAVGHEGSHVADAQVVVKSGLTEDGQKIYAGENITPYTSEQRAYGVTNSILGSENESRNFNCGLSTCTLGNGVLSGQVPGVVDQILHSNAGYNVNGKPMSSTNQGSSVVNGVTPKASVPH
jgi:RHS repeat-associated protein